MENNLELVAKELETLLNDLLNIKDKKDELSAQLDLTKKDYEVKSEEVWNFLFSLNLSSVNAPDGRKVIRILKTYPIITDFDQVKEWIENNGLDEDLLQLEIKKSELNKVMKKRMENGESEIPGTDFSASHELQVRR